MSLSPAALLRLMKLRMMTLAGMVSGPRSGDAQVCLRCGAPCYRRPDPEYEKLTGFEMYYCPTCRTEQNHEGLV